MMDLNQKIIAERKRLALAEKYQKVANDLRAHRSNILVKTDLQGNMSHAYIGADFWAQMVFPSPITAGGPRDFIEEVDVRFTELASELMSAIDPVLDNFIEEFERKATEALAAPTVTVNVSAPADVEVKVQRS